MRGAYIPGPSGKRPGEHHHNSYGGLDNCYDGPSPGLFPEGPGRPIITVIEASITVMMGLRGARPKRPGKAIEDREQGQQGGVFQTRLGQRGSAD